jgi:NitT/TauT family transport system permease protein
MWLVWVIAYHVVQNDYIVPSVWNTIKALGECFKRASFWLALWNTFIRTIIAFLISFVLSLLVASLSTLSKVFKAIIKPFVVLLRTLPTLAVILILLVWTTPKVAPIIVTVLVLFPVMLAQFEGAIGDIDGGIVEMANVYGIGKRERLFKIYLPLISPNIISQIGANMSLGLKIMISAEVLAATAQSLGGQMQQARSFVEMPTLAALTLVAILLGLVLDLCLSQLSRINYKWTKGDINAKN